MAHAEGKATLKPDEILQNIQTVVRAFSRLPPDDTVLLPRLNRLREEHRAEAVPTAKSPLTPAKPLGRLVLSLDVEEAKRLPPEQVRAHPAAAAFPGSVPADAPRVAKNVAVDTVVPAWHSTGLYAPPGRVVTVTVPEASAGKGLSVRIGAHSDRLWNLDAWRRCPELCREVPLAAPVTRAAGAFGGLIYIEAPNDCKLGAVSVRIAGAVEAPHFILGKTGLAEWRDKIRQRPAPWAELETKKVILTLPSSAVRTLDDPEDLMKFWDKVLDACAELAGLPLDRPRPERYVADLQISAGYMHSGYPIMTELDMPPVMVDKARMMRNGHGGVWGLWHEMGHNHQSRDWTFGGTGEVTENLFTLYVFDKACGRPDMGAVRLGREAGSKKIKAYLDGGAHFEKWKQDPFLGLVMYWQLQQVFGWDAYKKVFAEYRGLPESERPKTDDEKRDQWLVRFSRTIGKNLGPFFQAWGVPTSEKARASVADLPAWMPDGFPPG